MSKTQLHRCELCSGIAHSFVLNGKLNLLSAKKKNNTGNLGRNDMLKTEQWWHHDLFRAL